MILIKRLIVWIVVWFRQRFFAAVLVEPAPEVPPPPPLPAPAPPIVPPAFELHRPAKWAKPKGERPPAKPRPVAEPKAERPPRPKAPRPELRGEDPEQWGQYYFRDAILDQLDTYFTYLKRMRHRDRDAYEMHRKLGIHIMPRSAVQSFDNWRHGGEGELSAWWKTHRPGFGAVSYGIDRDSLEEETLTAVDASPEQWTELKRGDISKLKAKHRIAGMSKGRPIELRSGDKLSSVAIWVPKFLYFHKIKRVPPEVERVVDGDVYALTIYWDRVSGLSRGYHKRHKGGTPQEYAVCVERESGQVRVLRQLMIDTIKIASKKELGGSFKIPHKHWGYASEKIAGACGRTDMSPEDYLRRCFMEAALMYENASLGSMVRITASKGNLTATFGVDIKRMSYFFKDRDVVLNSKGSTARIFHIVRPHVRRDGAAVPMHFRGLKEFDWAGHKIAITVPGRDHFHLTEFDVGTVSLPDKPSKEMLTMGQVADVLIRKIKKGNGAWHRK